MHGIVTIALIAAFVFMLKAVATYGHTLVLLYSFSTLYHSVRGAAKKVLVKFDHCAIYLLIAGTYTPFTLITLKGPWGWGLFAFTWGLAFIGVAFKVLATGRFEKLSLAIYLGMGWCAIAAIQPLIRNLEPGGLALMLAGGITYSGGVAFYTWERLRYHHAIWHLFVLGGSVLHFFAVLFYVVPGPSG